MTSCVSSREQGQANNCNNKTLDNMPDPACTRSCPPAEETALVASNELVQLIYAWDKLPEPIRTAINTMASTRV